MSTLLVACGVGPVKIGMTPRMAPIGQSRDPDPTRVPFEQQVRPGGAEEPALAPACDPVTVGPVSAGVTVMTLLLSRFAGTERLFGIYGTFDENALVEGRTPRDRKDAAPAPCP